jgi:hypothetical protein
MRFSYLFGSKLGSQTEAKVKPVRQAAGKKDIKENCQ